MTNDVQLSTQGAVRLLTIDRTHRRNAMTPDTADELREGILAAQRDDGIGAVVLTGAGGHFSAGGDADAILEVAEGDSDEERLRVMRAFHALLQTIWDTDLPVIAAVSGVAYGGGFNLALGCDLIVCSADARFCQVFLRRGVVPDVGGAYLLPLLVGMQRAKELMLLTTECSAERAERMGFVNQVLPDADATLARAVEIGTLLADGPRFAVGLTKRLTNSCAGQSLRTALELEALTQATAMRSPGAREGFAALRH